MSASFENIISQRPDELEEFIKLLIQERVQSYLEIGLRIGTTFRDIGLRLPLKSVLVGVDLPGASGGVFENDTLDAIEEIESIAALLRMSMQDVTILWGDSRSSSIIERARFFAPYDAILIDGDHSREGAQADWEAYSPMAKIVALHDIDAGPGKKYGAAELWKELKTRFRHREIIGAERGMGLGVVWVREA